MLSLQPSALRLGFAIAALLCPAGTPENSPAFQRGVKRATPPSPAGTTEKTPPPPMNFPCRGVTDFSGAQGARHLCRFTVEKAGRVGLGLRDRYRALKRPEGRAPFPNFGTTPRHVRSTTRPQLGKFFAQEHEVQSTSFAANPFNPAKPMSFYWQAYQAGQIAEVRTDAAEAKVNTQQYSERVRDLEHALSRTTLACQALLWELLRARVGLTEDELLAKMTEVDLRDGTQDGRMTPVIIT